jgi:hypothetical protein
MASLTPFPPQLRPQPDDHAGVGATVRRPSFPPAGQSRYLPQLLSQQGFIPGLKFQRRDQLNVSDAEIRVGSEHLCVGIQADGEGDRLSQYTPAGCSARKST